MPEIRHVSTGLQVAVVKHRPLSPTETFIRYHVSRLPGRITLIDDPIARSANDQRGTNAYVRRLSEAKPDVVLAEYGKAGVVVLDACKELHLPLVVHFHGVDAYHAEVISQFGSRYSELFEYASAIIAVSRHMERRLLRLSADPDKIHCLPCGVDLRLFKPTRPILNAPILLAVGRFAATKAPHITLKAFAQAHTIYPTMRLRMIGEGELLQSCQDLASTLDVEGLVSFLGLKSHFEVSDEMRRARALVQHSVVTCQGDMEGTPLSIIEAGACGLPVISTRHGGILDAVVEGSTGLLCDELDVDCMANQMVRICVDPLLADTLGRAARARIAQLYSLDDSIAGLWKILTMAVTQLKHMQRRNHD